MAQRGSHHLEALRPADINEIQRELLAQECEAFLIISFDFTAEFSW